MKQIFYITLTIVIFLGFFAWTRILTPNSACPEETSLTGDCAFIGHRVTNSAGTNLGTVKNVIVDMHDGHPVYVMVSFDDPAFSGKAVMVPHDNKIVPIPWEKLTFAPAQKAILLNADETMLANAPQLEETAQGINQNLDIKIQQYWNKAADDEPCCPCRWCRVWN